ncbi:MAG: hypothetical protein WBS33_10810 [Verrucomicrobiia bacterium]
MVSEKGVSEFGHGQRLIFVPKEQIQRIEVKFGSQAERPLVQIILGLLLVGLGFVGLSLLISGGFVELRWGIGFILFGGLGVFCLYEVLRKGYYLHVISSSDTRKLVIKGAISKTEFSKFIKAAVQFGYVFQNCLSDKDFI